MALQGPRVHRIVRRMRNRNRNEVHASGCERNPPDFLAQGVQMQASTIYFSVCTYGVVLLPVQLLFLPRPQYGSEGTRGGQP